MFTPIRWGILGTGSIAHAFAHALSILPDAGLVAVGSRSQAAADRFGATFHIPNRHASYAALAADPEVDVIYIATPHVLHKENCLLCLEAGKAVLCEKPFTLNAREAAEVIAVAHERQLFVMEAMWTRFLPAIAKVRQWIAEDAIGEVRAVIADFGFRAPFDPESRLFAPELGGGALLDVGVYGISLASMLLGTPENVACVACLGETGVDEQIAATLAYAEGRLATVFAAVRTTSPIEATIMGTEGRIRIHSPFYRPEYLSLTQRRQQPLVSRIPSRIKRLGFALGLDKVWRRLNARPSRPIHVPFQGNGYQYQAEEVMRCMRAGKLESDVMPLDESLAIMSTMDRLREQLGLVYPAEQPRP
ncbi:MAG: Gfo/Idh/MocA family oxidoreductase [Anaerolineae bacterium]|nr:Gfo/Idh/MocA family oxidoreductase [Anaerolineae bacterium]